MRKILSITVMLVLVLSLCSFTKGETSEYDARRVAANLYEVTCDDYDYGYLLTKSGYGNIDFLKGGCSAVKKGSYLGRNFDFVAGDVAEIVVKTTRKKNRYATVGMVGGLLWLSSDVMESGLGEDAKKLIPLVLLDGINEKGLVVESNCVNAADVGGLTMHTNPGKEEVAQLCVVRYLLDKAATADEAIELMKNIDIVNTRDVMGLVAMGFEIHFLIADKDKTYVVEFDNTKPDGEKLIVMEDESVLTNFYLHLADTEKNIYSDNSMGVERYRKLADNRNTVDSVETMKALMQSIRFSNSNRQDGEYAPGENLDNPYTCFSDHPVFGENFINYANMKEHSLEILDRMKQDETLMEKILKDPKLENPNRLWFTVHNTVYDLENKTMSVSIYERYDKYYDYSLK